MELEKVENVEEGTALSDKLSNKLEKVKGDDLDKLQLQALLKIANVLEVMGNTEAATKPSPPARSVSK